MHEIWYGIWALGSDLRAGCAMEGRGEGLAADMASGLESGGTSASGPFEMEPRRSGAASPAVPRWQHSLEIRESVRSSMLKRAMERSPPEGYLEQEGGECSGLHGGTSMVLYSCQLARDTLSAMCCVMLYCRIAIHTLRFLICLASLWLSPPPLWILFLACLL